MPIKIIGMAAIIAAGGFAGLYMSGSLSKRVSELELVLLLIERLKTSIRYSHTHTSVIVAEAASHIPLSFLSDCRDNLDRQPGFPVAWRTALERYDGNLTAADIQAVGTIGGILGSCDAQGQTEALELTAERIGACLEDARKERDTKGKMYRSLGILAGVGLSIILA
ncbi:MAG: stage III sporulation protein AB [Oscillospiraceae bacterium]|nr:stage III sporulation protein AB [Oscillospiraceae bacterium]